MTGEQFLFIKIKGKGTREIQSYLTYLTYSSLISKPLVKKFLACDVFSSTNQITQITTTTSSSTSTQNTPNHVTSGGVTIVKVGGVVQSQTTQSQAVTPTPVGYTRRAKLGDSRSTGRLHTSTNTHRSMTRLNIAGGSVSHFSFSVMFIL